MSDDLLDTSNSLEQFDIGQQIDEAIMDLTQFEEDMDESTDLLYVMGSIYTEDDVEELISALSVVQRVIELNSQRALVPVKVATD